MVDYFEQFGFTILQCLNLDHLQELAPEAVALLINWHELPTNVAKIGEIFEHFTKLSIPLIIISDEPEPDIGIKMLEHGADDFLVKPLNPRELHARISAIKRRIQKKHTLQAPEREIFSFHNWCLYTASRQLFNEKNEELKLSISEYNLLLIFLRQPQQILKREYLLQQTNNSSANPLDRRIDIQISRLRQKIEANPKKPLLIKTIRNNGYIFTAQVSLTK